MTAPDLSAIAAAVRFRDRATAAAVAYHERVGLPPSTHYARATFDAIADLIRQDERERLAAAGRLVPTDAPVNPCQRGLGENRCTSEGTHEIVIDGQGTGVKMCGPHAREAVTRFVEQGEQSVSMRQVNR